MSSIGLSPQKLKELEAFVGLLRTNPQVLHLKELSFLKEYLESIGGKIPPPAEPKVNEEPPKHQAPKEKQKVPEQKEPEEPEEPEEEEKQEPDPDVVEPDNDAPLETGDTSKQVSDDDVEQAQNIKMEAMDAQREGKLQDSVALFTKAIKTNPHSGLLYAFRAQVLVEMKKPNAAIRDCDTAIKVNPDSAKPYKIRGRAHRMLGNYEAALRDFQQGQKLDFDDNTKKLEAEIKPRAEKLIARRLVQERKQREREQKEKQERIRRAQQARAEAAARQREEEEQQFGGGMPGFGGMPGGMPGFGGMPGMQGGGGGGMPFGLSPELFQSIMSDPEMIAAMQDPSFMSKLADIQQNPANISKYQHDEKVMRLVNKFASMFQGQGEGAEESEGGTFPSAEDVD